jgi:hypothetical protein
VPTTDPLTGASVPLNSDAPDGPGQIKAAVFGVSDNTIPYFTSTALRDSAYSTWVANGGVMRNSLVCAVGTTLYRTISGGSTWQAISVDNEMKMMSARREVDTAAFPNNAWTSFVSNTNWTENDPWGMHSNGGQLVAVYTGWYTINAIIWFNNNSTGVRGLGFQPSAGADIGEGNGQLIRTQYQMANTGGFDTIAGGTVICPLTAGATVDLQGFQTSGATIQINFVSIQVVYHGTNL